nr:SDR family NAD(P)-dependent oxidoreductase [Pollutimonas bauzanensis]
MKISLKPLKEQLIVITGASSGIGLATAREAARRGARLRGLALRVQAREQGLKHRRGMVPPRRRGYKSC